MYLTQVLGLKQILSADIELAKNYRFCIALSQELTHQDSELFEKMVSAMKIAKAEIETVVIESGDFSQTSALIVLYMNHDPGVLGQWKQIQGKKVIETLHPSLLIQAPQRKRETWEHMKNVLRELGLE